MKPTPPKAAGLFRIQSSVIFTTIKRAVEEALEQFVGEAASRIREGVNARDVFRAAGA